MVQLAITQYQPAAIIGMLADSGFTDKFSYSAETAVGIGRFVKLSTTYPDRAVNELTTATGQAALAIGVSIYAETHEQALTTGIVQINIGGTVPTLKRGRIWVQTAGAVTANNTANLVLATGYVTDAAVGTGIEAFTQFSARFITSTTAAGLAVVEINPK